MAITILPQGQTGSFASSFGTGLGAGIQQLVDDKIKDMQLQKAAKSAQAIYQAEGLPESEARALSLAPQFLQQEKFKQLQKQRQEKQLQESAQTYLTQRAGGGLGAGMAQLTPEGTQPQQPNIINQLATLGAEQLDALPQGVEPFIGRQQVPQPSQQRPDTIAQDPAGLNDVPPINKVVHTPATAAPLDISQVPSLKMQTPEQAGEQAYLEALAAGLPQDKAFQERNKAEIAQREARAEADKNYWKMREQARADEKLADIRDEKALKAVKEYQNKLSDGQKIEDNYRTIVNATYAEDYQEGPLINFIEAIPGGKALFQSRSRAQLEKAIKDIVVRQERIPGLRPSVFIANQIEQSILDKGLGKESIRYIGTLGELSQKAENLINQAKIDIISDLGKEPINIQKRAEKKVDKELKEIARDRDNYVKATAEIEKARASAQKITKTGAAFDDEDFSRVPENRPFLDEEGRVFVIRDGRKQFLGKYKGK